MNSRALAWRLVCGALFEHGGVRHEELEAIMRSARVSWPHVISLADNHLVTPALWLGLLAHGFEALLPPDVHRYLRTLYQMNATRNSALAAQLNEAIAVLNRSGVQPLLLKGASYLKLGIHGETSSRVNADLDLLVPETELERARQALERVGYRAAEDEPVSASTHHLPSLIRDGCVAAIELHREALSSRAGAILPAAELFAGAAADVSGSFLYCAPGHAVLHRFVHDQVIDRYAAQRVIALRGLQDLLALDAHYAGAIDWSELQHRAQQFGYGALFKNYLYSAARVAGLRSSSSMVSTSRQRAYFASCRASIRWALPGRVFALLDRFSGFQIRRIYGERQSVLSATLNRARVLYSMLRGVGARRIR